MLTRVVRGRCYAAPPSAKLGIIVCRGSRWLATTTDAGAPSSSTAIEVADPLLLYQSYIALGKVKMDMEQIRALVQMRKLHAALLDYQPPVGLYTILEGLRSSSDANVDKERQWPFQRSHLSTIGQGLLPEEEEERESILSLDERGRSKALVKVLKGDQNLEALDTPRGFLITGPPGTGKSMLLDLFFASLPVPHKVRFHYHHFLLSIYSKVHDALEKQRLEFEAEEKAMNESAGMGEEGYHWSRREEMKALAITKGWRAVFAGGRSPNDPDLNVQEFVLVGIARDLMKTHGWLLAFDEVQLVDIAGAGLINRVLSWYWRLGGVVIGTSNRVPEDLYNAGVQRESVNSFLVALASRSPVIELLSPLDYRREQRGANLELLPSQPPGDFGTVEAWKRWGKSARGWFVTGEEAEFTEAVDRLVGEEQPTSLKLSVYGRDLVVPRVVGGVAIFTFDELCRKALGPADYITLASRFHTIILKDIPIILLNNKNEARRLITLLDSLYETKTRLLAFAEAPIDSLFFPDAVKLAPSLAQPELASSPDDITPMSGENYPYTASSNEEPDSLTFPSNSVFRQAVDPAGEIGDSLTEEMMGDVIHDLEQPYRPNISSYDSSAGTALYNQDAARAERPKPKPATNANRPDPHPSAATPSFASLAIFTGEEERFAFKRAVSRVYEIASAEFLTTAQHSPLDASFRTWEKPKRQPTPKARSATLTPEEAMGPTSPLDGDKLSGAITPNELRLRFPDGMPKHPEVDVEGARRKEGGKGEKVDPLATSGDVRRTMEPPVMREHHVWGVREDWGKGAGEWGKGAARFADGKEKDAEHKK